MPKGWHLLIGLSRTLLLLVVRAVRHGEPGDDPFQSRLPSESIANGSIAGSSFAACAPAWPGDPVFEVLPPPWPGDPGFWALRPALSFDPDACADARTSVPLKASAAP